MDERPTYKTIKMHPQLENVMQFRLVEINETKDYFIAEVCEREIMSKGLNEYVAVFNYV